MPSILAVVQDLVEPRPPYMIFQRRGSIQIGMAQPGMSKSIAGSVFRPTDIDIHLVWEINLELTVVFCGFQIR